jgi:putative ATPase
MIEADTLSSIILYGPPGTGKTTIASVIAEITNCIFQSINATTAGKADMKKVTDNASKALEEKNTRTILFIDEIHRFNKAQQDFLLPFVENGTIVLIGATTENPYFEINGALLSRSQIFELKPLDEQAMRHIVDRAITTVNQTAFFTLNIEPEAIDFFVNVADGDARQILNAIDLALRTTPATNGTITIDLPVASECIQKKIKQ